MKVLGVVGTAVAFLAFGTASGIAQQAEEHPRQEESKPQHPQEARPAEHPQQRQEAKPQSHPQTEQKRTEQTSRPAQDNQRKAQTQDNHRAQEDQKRVQQDQQHAREAQQKQTRQNSKAQAEQQHRAQQDRDRQVRNDQQHPVARPQTQRRSAAYHGRIPEQNFHQHFGREHHFRFHRPEIYQGRPRFQYGGYWFYISDPWPSAWSYDDDVYVDYVDDQYYLFDPVHPGMRVVINVDL
jgi:hypothetical protein